MSPCCNIALAYFLSEIGAEQFRQGCDVGHIVTGDFEARCI